MLTFTQYITEKFVKGIEGLAGGGSYAEAYKNPTLSEIKEAGHHINYVPSNLTRYGESCYHLAGFLGPDLVVWNREKADHSEAAYSLFHGPTPSQIPFYMTYFPGTKTAALSLAYFSLMGNISIDQFLQKAKTHKAFKIFSAVIRD